MSQAEVNAINAHTDAQIAALTAAIPTARQNAQAVHTQQLYADVWPRSDGTTEPLTFARAAKETLSLAQVGQRQTDTLEASGAAAGAALAEIRAAVGDVQAVVDRLPGSVDGGGVTREELAEELAAALSRIHVIIDPPAGHERDDT